MYLAICVQSHTLLDFTFPIKADNIVVELHVVVEPSGWVIVVLSQGCDLSRTHLRWTRKTTMKLHK